MLASNTFSIMCHHLLGFFVLNCLVFLISSHTPLFGLFSAERFLTSIYYTYVPHGISQFALLYAAFGVLFSLAIHACWLRFKAKAKTLLH